MPPTLWPGASVKSVGGDAPSTLTLLSLGNIFRRPLHLIFPSFFVSLEKVFVAPRIPASALFIYSLWEPSKGLCVESSVTYEPVGVFGEVVLRLVLFYEQRLGRKWTIQ